MSPAQHTGPLPVRQRPKAILHFQETLEKVRLFQLRYRTENIFQQLICNRISSGALMTEKMLAGPTHHRRHEERDTQAATRLPPLDERYMTGTLPATLRSPKTAPLQIRV